MLLVAHLPSKQVDRVQVPVAARMTTEDIDEETAYVIWRVGQQLDEFEKFFRLLKMGLCL